MGKSTSKIESEFVVCKTLKIIILNRGEFQFQGVFHEQRHLLHQI